MASQATQEVEQQARDVLGMRTELVPEPLQPYAEAYQSCDGIHNSFFDFETNELTEPEIVNQAFGVQSDIVDAALDEHADLLLEE